MIMETECLKQVLLSSFWLRWHRSNAFIRDETARMDVLAEMGKPMHYNWYSKESKDVEPKKYSRKMLS